MKDISFSLQKNSYLIRTRNISFEDIVTNLAQKNTFVKVIEHPQPDKYPNQHLLLIQIKKYIYVVPYVESSTVIFLKTIYPSRKYTKLYLGKNYGKK